MTLKSKKNPTKLTTVCQRTYNVNFNGVDLHDILILTKEIKR